MKNIVGQTPRGADFFPRDAVINKTYRRLEAGNNIFMSAPRRAGKTAIMRFLEDRPRKGYAFLYISVEDVESSEEFFQVLSEELLESKAVSRLIKASEKAQSIFSRFAEHVKKIKVWNLELETQSKPPPQYSEEFEKLTRDLDTSDFKIVLLIDEFPIALERIEKTSNTDAAREFLHMNRSIRQRAKQGLLFVYTGSIGLPNIARKLNATATINDLNVIEVPPLTVKQAKQFAQLLLRSYKVKTRAKVVDYMLKRLHWLMPFFIQLIIQMLIDEFETHQEPITRAIVDRVIEKASNHRNNIYFESYYSRLDKSLTKEESELAKRILSEIAENDELPLDHFVGVEDAISILDILEFDGYINSNGNAYRFNSPILQLWWSKHAN
ncbi:MAG: hypothetical protein AAF985_24300 [Bacteroidota bacterium]